jgi:phosphomannomutase
MLGYNDPMTTLLESLTHPPVELRFGTSGLRGLVTDMTDLECYINTRGFLAFLAAADQVGPGQTIYIGADLRSSSPRIAAAVAQAASDAGHHPKFCGLVPTPALAYFALSKHTPCIMVSGSHIPSDRNGIKFYRPDGEVLKSDEAHIFQAVATVRKHMYAEPATTSAFTEAGQLRQSPRLDPHPLQDEVLVAYSQRYIDFFGNSFLRGKTIVVYQHSSVARDLLVSILQDLGASVKAVGRSETFIPIDTENVTPEDQRYFLQLARDNPNAFAIVSMDGDADRPFVIDERGTFHRGDVVCCLVADYLGASHASMPVTASDAVLTFLQKRRIAYSLTKIGSPYVVAAMQEHSGAASVGWEVNGGFMTSDSMTKEERTLAPLPTRDAMLPILAVLAMAVAQHTSLSQLFATLPARFTAAGLLDGVPGERTEKVISWLRTEPGKAEIARLGVGHIKETNDLDGERITFQNGDILHLRQSGNAPQLRVYSVADSQSRADELVLSTISPKGWLAGLVRKL